MTDSMPENVDDLLARVDEDTAYRIGKQMGALYVGFLESVARHSKSTEEQNDAKMYMLMSFMMAYQIGTKQ
jgi:hypothetical protein